MFQSSSLRTSPPISDLPPTPSATADPSVHVGSKSYIAGLAFFLILGLIVVVGTVGLYMQHPAGRLAWVEEQKRKWDKSAKAPVGDAPMAPVAVKGEGRGEEELGMTRLETDDGGWERVERVDVDEEGAA